MITQESVQRFRIKYEEENDCVVTAFAIAAQISYRRAHHLAKLSGREHCKGFWTDEILPIANKRGIMMRKIMIPKLTLRRFANMHPFGNYVVESMHHAIAIVDGVIHDKAGRNSIIVNVFKIDYSLNKLIQ